MVQQVHRHMWTGSGAVIAINPAGTANLLATNLGIPRDHKAACRTSASMALTARLMSVSLKRRTVRGDGRQRDSMPS